jgi:prepilin-type N-terminal cleavage/methylation domain-containing protein
MNQRGITLLELLVALTLGAVVLLAAGSFYRTVAWTSKADFSQAFLQDQATIVVDELTRQVEAASTIAACFPGSECLVGTCDDQTTFLYVAQPDGSIYCFYRTTSGQFMEYRQPAGGFSGNWNMLSNSPAPLIVTTFDICGSPPYATCQTTTDIAYVSFRLQGTGLLGGASDAPTVAYSVAIAKRN